MVEIPLAQTKPCETSHCYKAQTTHLCCKLALASQVPKQHPVKWKTAHHLRPPADGQCQQATFQTLRLWTTFELLDQVRDTLYILAVLCVSEGLL